MTIWHASARRSSRLRHARCVEPEHLRRLYTSTSDTSIPTEVLAEIVTCPRCLDLVSRLTQAPPRVERPRDSEPPSQGSRPSSLRATARQADRRAAAEHVCRAVRAHRPRLLRVFVNGFEFATHEISCVAGTPNYVLRSADGRAARLGRGLAGQQAMAHRRLSSRRGAGQGDQAATRAARGVRISALRRDRRVGSTRCTLAAGVADQVTREQRSASRARRWSPTSIRAQQRAATRRAPRPFGLLGAAPRLAPTSTIPRVKPSSSLRDSCGARPAADVVSACGIVACRASVLRHGAGAATQSKSRTCLLRATR